MARDRKVDHKREISCIIYLMFALILSVAYYLPAGKLGWLGDILHTVGFGFLGVGAFALPIVFISMTVDHFLERRIKNSRKRFTYLLIILIGSVAILHIATVDPSRFITLTAGDTGAPEAFAAIRLLWNSGVDPSRIADPAASADPLTGGLLGGGLAFALTAIAGKVGALILLGALLASQLVLFLNVSLSKAIGRTAEAINKTRKRVDDAVRSSVANIRQTQIEEEQISGNYDIDLEKQKQKDQQTEPVQSLPESEAKKKPSFLQSLKRLWHVNDLPVITPEELAVPDFLQPEGQTEVPAQPAASADISPQTSPYDLRINATPDLPASPGVSGATPEFHADAPVLPAGIRRVPSTQDFSGKPTIGSEASSTVENGRAHWQDRADPAGSGVDFIKPRSQAGDQLAIQLPYEKPPIHLLRKDTDAAARTANTPAIQALGRKLEHTLDSFGIQATVIRVTTGPTITRFELSPGPGVKVSRIVSLSDDIALNLAAMGVRIEAPIPGKSAIGIEIPNKETTPVLLRGLLESTEFTQSQSPLMAALGRDVQGSPILCDLAKMPHLLIAGATGSGKSVCINSILMSILYRSSPDDVRMMMIDPKVVELSVYNGIPHLLAPVVTDPKKAANALNWAVSEMVRRYGLFADKSVRDINSYNSSATVALARGDDDYEKLPLILFVIDELSDLMATTPTEVEDAIARLTAMARAAGIHLIIATQRPSVDVITGVIKANIPSRIAFAVASQVDSRTILDMGGAEKLLGKGDLLYYPQSLAKPLRGQGAFVTDAEVERVLTWLKSRHVADYNQEVTDTIMTATANGGHERDQDDEDELIPQALDVVVETGYASVSLLQRRLKLGYPRAARLIDALHDKGFVGPFDGSKPRKVLITQDQYLELKARGDG
ncbi:MAG: DNA translocase FtsK [Saccharofermentanales bacterium]|jgi:DNA segregation ATPase FtsK/SpoIIIE-like protein